MTDELTPEQRIKAITAGVVITLVGWGTYGVIKQIRKRAFSRRVAKMVAEQMPEVDAYAERLKAHLNGRLEHQRKLSADILARIENATRKLDECE